MAGDQKWPIVRSPAPDQDGDVLVGGGRSGDVDHAAGPGEHALLVEHRDAGVVHGTVDEPALVGAEDLGDLPGDHVDDGRGRDVALGDRAGRAQTPSR